MLAQHGVYEHRAEAVAGGRHAADGETGMATHEIGIRLGNRLAEKASELRRVDAMRAGSHHEHRAIRGLRAKDERIGDLRDVTAEKFRGRFRRARCAGKLDDARRAPCALERFSYALHAGTRQDAGIGSHSRKGRQIILGRMELLAWAWDIAVHLDARLAQFVQEHGVWVYALLFCIIFCETGLVVTPFLPGDSLLFVVGALAAAGNMDIALVMAVLVAAALCGDNVNYAIGRWTGTRLFSRWLNPIHMQRTRDFYARHGGKTIVIARFVPIVRTYVPFVAGLGAMPYPRYIVYCVLGALLWVGSLCLAGYFFGNIPVVKENLTLVIIVIVLLSISPGLLAWMRSRASVQGEG